MRKRRYGALARGALIAKLRELGFDVAQQQDAVTALSGVVVGLITANDEQQLAIDKLVAGQFTAGQQIAALEARLRLQEARQPASFGA